MHNSFTISSFVSLESSNAFLQPSWEVQCAPKLFRIIQIHSRATLLSLTTGSSISLVRVETAIWEILLFEKITEKVWKIGMWLEQTHTMVFPCECSAGLTMWWSAPPADSSFLFPSSSFVLQWQSWQLPPHSGDNVPWCTAGGCAGGENRAASLPARHCLMYGQGESGPFSQCWLYSSASWTHSWRGLFQWGGDSCS